MASAPVAASSALRAISGPLIPASTKIILDLGKAVQALTLADEVTAEMMALPYDVLAVCGEDLFPEEITGFGVSLEILLPLLQAECSKRSPAPCPPSAFVEKIRRHKEGQPDRRTIPGAERVLMAVKLLTDRMSSIADAYNTTSPCEFADELDKLSNAVPILVRFCEGHMWAAATIYQRPCRL